MNKLYLETGNQRLHNFGFPTIKEFNKRGKKMIDEWKKTEAEIFSFEKIGDSIEGVLRSKEIGGKYGNEVYKIDSNGKLFVVFSTVVLQANMSGVNVMDSVKIVYTGTKPNLKDKENDIKLYDVFTK